MAISAQVVNKDVRKLYLYAKDGCFDTTIDSTVVSCFIHMANVNIHFRKEIKGLHQRQESKHFTVDEYTCVLVRESALREYATLAGGMIPILRFLYASEPLNYDWYP